MNSFPERTLVYVQRQNSPVDPMRKLRIRFQGPYMVKKEFRTKVHVIPYKNDELLKDAARTHIRGHGRPVPKLKHIVVDKTRLKKVNSLQMFSPEIAKQAIFETN